jgi:mono/diheme cytochrome c family protein
MRKPLLLMLVIIPLIVFSSLPVFAGGDAVAGKDPYLKKCATCHGAAGEGKEAVAKMLKVTLSHLGSKQVQAKTDADLRKIPLEGTGKMKPVKDVNAQMAEDIIAYVRTLAQK